MLQIPIQMAAIPEFHSPHTNHLHWIPDNVTTPQFFLDYHHPNSPIWPENTPWFIDNEMGATFGTERVSGLHHTVPNQAFILFEDVNM